MPQEPIPAAEAVDLGTCGAAVARVVAAANPIAFVAIAVAIAIVAIAVPVSVMIVSQCRVCALALVAPSLR